MAKNKRRRPGGREAAQAVGREAPKQGRRWIWGAVPILLVLAAAGAWWFGWRSAPVSFTRTADQNVLLITIDTMRADALGSAGGRAATPNLDRLAALGVRYDFAHAHAVITLPSHASILTGLYPFEHAVRDNAGFKLAAKTPTLATMLRAHGMATGAFIGSFALDSRFGLNAGFDVYDEHYGKSNVSTGFTMAERRADAVVGVAKAWLAAQRGKWFAWVHVFDPHAPYSPPAPYDQQYADAPYYGEVAWTDFALGPLLDAARDPSGRPTLVVVTGDHGEGLGDHGEMTHGLFAYEATLHIPLIVAQIDRNTGNWSAGGPAVGGRPTVSSIDARHIDLVPTVLDALGLPKPGGLQGRTLLPDSAGADAGDRTSYFESLSTLYNRGWAPLTGVLSNRQKYIDLPLPELYDLKTDPLEAANLLDRAPDVRRALERRLQAFSAPAAAAGDIDPETRARLQSLGYLSGSAQQRGRYTEADDPKRLVGVDQQLRHAIDLYERHRPAEAIPVYKQVIAERPTMEVAYSQLAVLQWEMDQPAEAIATLRAAVAAGCGGAEIKTRLGTYLAETGNVKEAVPLLQQTASANAADTDALNALGIALARAGQPRQAQATFERILTLEPGNTLALENLGAIALGDGRMADARRYFTAALQADEGSTEANNGLAIVELKAGNRAAAIERFKLAVARDSRNYDALYNLGTELVNDGQMQAARPYLEQFVNTAPPTAYARDIARVRELLARMSR
jgi:arylsulfatase A-like enzyme/tetratricopeptide (TPR) repeat protein